MTKKDGEIAAVSSTQRLSLIGGRYIGKDDPVAIVRCQSQFPAVGEVLKSYAQPHIVEGWMRGSHFGPLIPVSVPEATPSCFDGPPRVIALGFQIAGGRLVGPRDMFDDPSLEPTPSPEPTSAPKARATSLEGPPCPETFQENRVITQEIEIDASSHLTLGSTASIPCGWQTLEIGDPAVLHQVTNRRKWPAEGVTPMPGAPGTEIWGLEVLEAGEATVSVACTCLGEEGKEDVLCGRFVLDVTVR